MDNYIEQLMNDVWGDDSAEIFKFKQEFPGIVTMAMDALLEPWSKSSEKFDDLVKKIKKSYEDVMKEEIIMNNDKLLEKIKRAIPEPPAGEAVMYEFTFPEKDDIRAVVSGEKDLMEFKTDLMEFKTVKSRNLPQAGLDLTYDD